MGLPHDDEVHSLSGWREHFVNKGSEATMWEGEYILISDGYHWHRKDERQQGFPKHALPVKHLFYGLITETRETK